MQTSQAFGQVQDALSFRTSYDTFAQYRAALDRLCGFLDANAQTRELPQVVHREQPGALDIEHLQVSRRPDGHHLLSGLQLKAHSGQALLIKGPSGSGKTTLLRSIAGLWPHAQGTVGRPGGHQALFLSQRPYLPWATCARPLLSDGCFTAGRRAPSTGAAPGQPGPPGRQAGCQPVGPASCRLASSSAWLRVLFNRPRHRRSRESTSAMDEGLEHALPACCASRCSTMLVVWATAARWRVSIPTWRSMAMAGGRCRK
jgi:putative ATP-binding cassette transporter